MRKWGQRIAKKLGFSTLHCWLDKDKNLAAFQPHLDVVIADIKRTSSRVLTSQLMSSLHSFPFLFYSDMDTCVLGHHLVGRNLKNNHAHTFARHRKIDFKSEHDLNISRSLLWKIHWSSEKSFIKTKMKILTL